MNRIVLAGLVGLALGACRPMEPETKTPLQPEERSILRSSSAKSMDLTAVEHALHLTGALAPQSEAANVTADEMVSARSFVNLTTITVAPPYPEALWVTFRVKSTANFPDAPVALRTRIHIDQEVVDTFSMVLGADATKTSKEQAIDVLAHVAAAPETMLVHARADAVLLPEGTDPASVDPDTVTAPPERTGTVMSNPVRINFVSGEAAS